MAPDPLGPYPLRQLYAVKNSSLDVSRFWPTQLERQIPSCSHSTNQFDGVYESPLERQITASNG